ncbi:uncharacterized protein LOC142348081 [Convolutriloba macropyga]|uniref:uncharacterized protein LOC142348081 n=1 Tax=Convolutriloba macropyga TaxID=536237 RepID=UPI003F51EC75
MFLTAFFSVVLIGSLIQRSHETVANTPTDVNPPSNSSRKAEWQTLYFVLPNEFSAVELARECAQYSRRYCFMGRLITKKQTEREPEDLDMFNFVRSLFKVYKDINWFSFSNQRPQERGTCCHNQFAVYRYFGQSNGLSPDEYLDSVMDFSPEGKNLNFIKAIFDRHFCANVITMLGFGPGPMKRIGVIHDAIYLLNPNDSGLAFFFHQDKIRETVTFDWFKKHIICQENRWICQKWPPANSTV